MITKELTALFILAILPALASHCQEQRWHYVHFLVVNTSSIPCLYLPLHPSILTLLPPVHSLSYFHSFPLSVEPPSTCFIPLQLLFLTLHLSASIHFLSFFQYFPSSLSLYCLYP